MYGQAMPLEQMEIPLFFEPVYPDKKAEGNAPPFAIKKMNKQINNLLTGLTLLTGFLTLAH